ncbi:BrnT family toxin [Bosea sp. (in: a-proteobacteria)]|jgi:uncharacterized DUF497 family protein|uniref:BrnT family toxin n=1 Tax=Bosea sp. (in: a-proteobacteria) TaxID=1871050 RepID=UPI003F71A130
MGSNERCSWDDGKRSLNIANHGYDFADLAEAFDGRFALVREDRRFDYGEDRYNMLVELRGRILNVTFTPRAGLMHLISVRPASRDERSVYHGQHQAE